MNTRVSIIQKTMDKSLMHLCVHDEVCNIYPQHRNWILKCIREKRKCFIVSSYETDCGCAIVKDGSIFQNMLKISYFYILPLYRHRKYGTRLLAFIEEFARRNGYKGAYITVNSRSLQMQTFLDLKSCLEPADYFSLCDGFL